MFLNRLEQDIHNQLHSVCKSDVGDFIHHQQKQFADRAFIGVASLLERKKHIANENQGYMSVQRVIRL